MFAQIEQSTMTADTMLAQVEWNTLTAEMMLYPFDYEKYEISTYSIKMRQAM